MNVEILLDIQNHYVFVNDVGQEVQVPLDLVTTPDNPVFINSKFESFPRVYINEEAYKMSPDKIEQEILRYLGGAENVQTISVPSELWSGKIKDAVINLPKNGLTIRGEHKLSSEDYKLLEETKCINVFSCDDELLNKSNILITAPMEYQSELFSKGDRVCDTIKKSNIEISQPLTEAMKVDLSLFFKWSRNLEYISIEQLSVEEILETFKNLEPYLDKIPSIKIELALKEKNYEHLKQISDSLKEHKDKVTVNYQIGINKDQYNGNHRCTLDEYMTMDEILCSYQEAITSQNYSPLEQLIYSYDIVKNADYQEANKNENRLDVRNLHKVVLGGKIVCVGFSNLLNGLLTKLGIPACDYSLGVYRDEGNVEYHQRSVIYLQDEKYGINGMFICDPTWDARTSIDIGYEIPMDRYNYFLKPYDQMKHTRGAENINSISCLSVKDEFLKTTEYYNTYQSGLCSINRRLGMIDTSNVVIDDELENISFSEKDKYKREKTYQYLREEIPKFKQDVPFEVIASAIATVRRNEGFYQSEEELQNSIRKIIELHNQYYPMKFNDEEVRMFWKVNGQNQVFYNKVKKDYENSEGAKSK